MRPSPVRLTAGWGRHMNGDVTEKTTDGAKGHVSLQKKKNTDTRPHKKRKMKI